MSRTVFFSWQSDRPTKEGRNLIEKALQIAVARIAEDVSVEEAVRDGLTVDKDTKGVPGTPPIFQTILDKIDRASVFVPDLTFCGTRCDGRPTPNPNVLIEYGWALKSLGYSRMLTVMNIAHGKPSSESMPFNLASLRFPITYNLPTGATDDTRNTERDRLAKDFETALRRIFDSEEFKTKLLKQPEAIPFSRRNPINGKARFRPPQKPLGFVRDIISQMVGEPRTNPIYLAEGPAIWMRVAPLYSPGRTWLTQDLKQQGPKLILLPLVQTTGSVGFLQDEDGCGFYQIWQEGQTYSVSYVFSTGEVWLINALLARVPGYVQLDESSYNTSLKECASFLDDLGCVKPYWWSVGMEGVQGRQLAVQIPNRSSRMFGPCLTNIIEQDGIYKKDDKPAELLRPFFEKLFDQCGARRPASNDAE